MSEVDNELNQLSNNFNDINTKKKDLIQSSEHSSINTLATNSSHHLTSSKKENSHTSSLLSAETILTNSHSTLNPGDLPSKNSNTVSNHSKMTQIHENEADGSVTNQTLNNTLKIPQSSENSLNSKTPTEKRSLKNISNNNNNDDDDNKMFDLNDKHLSITLSSHSSESASSINKEEDDDTKNKKSSPKESRKKSSDKEKEEKENGDDKTDKGTKKFGFKHFKNTISKTFSKASFRKFSVSHKKTINGTTTSSITEQPQDFGFTSKEEQEEFNNFVNTLNTKKSKQRPSLNGLFLNPEFSTPHNNSMEGSVPSTITEETASNDNLYNKNTQMDNTGNLKDAPPEMNEMRNIEGNARKQAPVIIERKGRRVK